MIRAIFGFLAVWGIVFFGLSYFWHTPRKEKYAVLRTVLYSLMTAVIAMVVMITVVVMF